MKLLKNKKVTFVALLAILAVLSTQSVSAMHIMEGYLPLFWCIFWFAVFLPFFVVGLMRIKKIVAEDPNSKTMLALSGAFIFILSSLKIPDLVRIRPGLVWGQLCLAHPLSAFWEPSACSSKPFSWLTAA